MVRSHNGQHGRLVGFDRNGGEICVHSLFAVDRMAGDHTAHADHELDRVAELLFEVTVVRLEDAVLDADRELCADANRVVLRGVYTYENAQ